MHAVQVGCRRLCVVLWHDDALSSTSLRCVLVDPHRQAGCVLLPRLQTDGLPSQETTGDGRPTLLVMSTRPRERTRKCPSGLLPSLKYSFSGPLRALETRLRPVAVERETLTR